MNGGIETMVKLIIGAFWGDEGKGKAAHACNAEVAIRSTGGANAGHTVVANGKKYAMHLLPSSILKTEVKSIIGPGVVVDLAVLVEELETIISAGIKPNLFISDRATLVLPTDKKMDFFVESIKEIKVGTTGRGIGPAYAAKDHRIAIRMGDLKRRNECKEQLLDKVRCNLAFASLFNDKWKDYEDSSREIFDYLDRYIGFVEQYICDTQEIINKALEDNANIIIEGAQAMYLDRDHGDYPFVTSSNPTAGGACCGAGIGPRYITDVVGVMKAYCSRVGEGPFPTELSDETGDKIRELGHEFGTTTGRPRRCGWLDLVRAKNAVHVNSISEWCINHLDTIGKIGQIFGSVKICVGYEYMGKVINYVPIDSENVTPIYTEINGGWDTNGCRTYEELPNKARKYIEFIEEYTGVPVKTIGIGPADTDIIIKT